MTDTRYIILLQGHEYDPRKGLPFREKCEHLVTDRIRYLEEHKKDAVLPHGLTLPTNIVFLRLDAQKGVIQQYTHLLKSGPRSTFVMTKHRWDPADITELDKVYSIATPRRALVQKDDYEMGPEDDHPQLRRVRTIPGVPISIADAYQCVRQAPAGSVIELSIMSHGYYQGPIITNSSDKDNKFNIDPKKSVITDLRDPADFDGRFYVDFNSKMGVTPLVPVLDDRLTQFKNAFAPDATIHIWGCNGDGEVERMLGMLRQLQKKKKNKENLTDATLLYYTYEKPVIDPKTKLPKIDPKTKKPETTVEVASITWRKYQAYLGILLRNSYSYACASATGVTTYGMFTGITSDNSGDELMVIGKSCKLTLAFYKKHLTLKADSRGYGLFDAVEVAKIKAL